MNSLWEPKQNRIKCGPSLNKQFQNLINIIRRYLHRSSVKCDWQTEWNGINSTNTGWRSERLTVGSCCGLCLPFIYDLRVYCVYRYRCDLGPKNWNVATKTNGINGKWIKSVCCVSNRKYFCLCFVSMAAGN